jgi:hypothetical protein
MELIDEGETDHKIIVLRSTDTHFDRIHTVADLERYYPMHPPLICCYILYYQYNPLHIYCIINITHSIYTVLSI